MKTPAILFIVILFFMSCSQSKNEDYKLIIEKTTRIEVYYKTSDKRVELDSTQVQIFKKILKRNIEPSTQRKFIPNIRIDLFEENERIGFLMIIAEDSKPFVNFNSENLNFGFQLTYGIGQYLIENEPMIN